MTAQAIAQVTEALKTRIESGVGADKVYVGPPLPDDVGERTVSLLLFQLEPSRELRNTERWTRSRTDPTEPLLESDALPLDLRYLITVFRVAGNGGIADPNELTTLGQVVQALHAQPTLGGSLLPEQEVRVTPEPYPVEELTRVWGLFPQTFYRTSVVYLASPVFVESGPVALGSPVVERRIRGGLAADPPDLLRSRSAQELR